MIRLHHVQVSCPPGGEDAARAFWGDGFGLTEVPKPRELAGRGGVWFRSLDTHGQVQAEIHVGVEDPFTPARKAHPAFVLGAEEFAALAERLVAAGIDLNHTERTSFPGHLRFHCADPFGNRVEVLTPEG